MSRKQRYIKSQTINYEEPYATFKRPTNATFIPAEIMETNAEKTSVRQTSEDVYAQSGLAKDTEAEGQAETTCFVKIMESKTVGFFT